MRVTRRCRRGAKLVFGQERLKFRHLCGPVVLDFSGYAIAEGVWNTTPSDIARENLLFFCRRPATIGLDRLQNLDCCYVVPVLGDLPAFAKANVFAYLKVRFWNSSSGSVVP